MPSGTRDYTSANRRAWDEAAPAHRTRAHFETLLEGFGGANFSILSPLETQRLQEIGVERRDVAQLCCNNGRELLSIKNLAAGRCVGFDQSSGFLAQAVELAEAGGIDCRFVESDIYQISREFDACFDLVVVTIGVLGWMPDLGGFFDVAKRLLRPGGNLFIHEQHPITNMLEPGDPDPYRLVHSYFKPDPFVENEIIVYDEEDAGAGETHYWFCHTLADVITACLERGLTLRHFAEAPANISSDEFDKYENQAAQLPLSYTLTARKAEDEES
jgi:SAM-dependent methyltransferase